MSIIPRTSTSLLQLASVATRASRPRSLNRRPRRLLASTPSRPFSAPALTSHHPAHLIFSPSPTDLQNTEFEYDVDLLPPEEARLEMTDRAAEQLRAIATRENDPDVALRISVESGGCHGYQYKMDLTSHREPDDYQFTHSTIQPSNIVVDAVSLSLLKGSTIDFATELIGSSFRVVENPQAKGSGCGCGVSWELKI